jgi:hypothetical protein
MLLARVHLSCARVHVRVHARAMWHVPCVLARVRARMCAWQVPCAA